jgi:hypothetical protein
MCIILPPPPPAAPPPSPAPPTPAPPPPPAAPPAPGQPAQVALDLVNSMVLGGGDSVTSLAAILAQNGRIVYGTNCFLRVVVQNTSSSVAGSANVQVTFDLPTLTVVAPAGVQNIPVAPGQFSYMDFSLSINNPSGYGTYNVTIGTGTDSVVFPLAFQEISTP